MDVFAMATEFLTTKDFDSGLAPIITLHRRYILTTTFRSHERVLILKTAHEEYDELGDQRERLTRFVLYTYAKIVNEVFHTMGVKSSGTFHPKCF